MRKSSAKKPSASASKTSSKKAEPVSFETLAKLQALGAAGAVFGESGAVVSITFFPPDVVYRNKQLVLSDAAMAAVPKHVEEAFVGDSIADHLQKEYLDLQEVLKSPTLPPREYTKTVARLSAIERESLALYSS